MACLKPIWVYLVLREGLTCADQRASQRTSDRSGAKRPTVVQVTEDLLTAAEYRMGDVPEGLAAEEWESLTVDYALRADDAAAR